MPIRPPSPGALIENKYRLAERIGGGGMGDVFRAENLVAARAGDAAKPHVATVAIKFLHPELAQNIEVAQRFFQEAQAVTRIRHPNVVEVIDAGTGEMGPYIVMEYLDGESVGSALSRVGRFEVDAAVATTIPVLEALDAAHRVGIIHRDLKPENIFVAQDAARGAATVRLLDFGIAKVLDASGPGPRTRTGVVFGTPDYLSPEQATGDGPLDGRSDLFAVGVLLYEMLTGLRPFRAPTAVATAFKVVHAEAPTLASTGVHVDARLEQVVHRLLQKEPARRFPAAPEVIRELDKITPDANRRAVALARIVGAVRRLAQSAPTLESERFPSRDSTRRGTPPFGLVATQPSATLDPRAPLTPRTMGGPRLAEGASADVLPPASWASRPAGDLSRTGRSSMTGLAGATAAEVTIEGSLLPRAALQTLPEGSPPIKPSPVGRVPAPRPFPPRFAGRFQVRGPVLRSVDRVVVDVFGPVARDEVVALMPETLAVELRHGAINALVAYELEALDAYMERATALLVRDPGRWRDFGRLAVDGELYNVVRTLLRPAVDVGGVVRRGVSTWARLFSFGTWRVGSSSSGKVTLTIGELEAVAQPLRLWTVGMVEQTMRRAVRADLRVIITGGEQEFIPELTCEIG